MFANALSNAVIFNQAHPLEVSDYINSHIGHHTLLPESVRDSDEFCSQLKHRDFAELGLSSIHYGNEVKIHCADLNDIYHFQVVTRGQCCWQFEEESLLLKPGQALMMNPHEKMDISYSADCEKIIVKVPQTFIRDLCLEQNRVISSSGILFERKVIELDKSLGFLSLMGAILHEANDAELDLLQMQLPYRDLLIRKLFQQFDNNTPALLDSDPNDRNFTALLQHIEENIKEDIGVEELANVGHISVRKVYNLFAKHYHITPKVFIKQSKLKHLRQEIITNNNIRNITEIALDYGFSHLGRFSSDYRKMFSELPSETLKRR
ncbi:helix-turn-helix domain-containing protein [Marinomonas mediterranea]|jgi:AraC-type DNA-binding domain-containing proteins|uniref:AraC protein arabinose-binding/dimerization n=1 Tax=Marinomonas mediterranea (strain ATCC 700492 / JCM 21426 / NBRC 103028 / MMB-1) TaxID=717774 RepID=F2JYW1_MARM1|nr:AraC family transcriptional regulator [Marinomonas mediterranea]ADZ90826.1 AraC protein arabinose-binding/dimerization [Marinomonas mediterranea MMB-1]WCN12910.1 helix-turn-helix domain-containing protein [Marinomonas mediterranea]WCN16979.1 helix-turn-helix domain-containing protein [Marinomonas mediterranea MMB-1]